MASRFEKKVNQLLSLAGVRVNGDRSWDIQVHDERLYQRVLSQGALGLGESYMDGWWETEILSFKLCRFISGTQHPIMANRAL